MKESSSFMLAGDNGQMFDIAAPEGNDLGYVAYALSESDETHSFPIATRLEWNVMRDAFQRAQDSGNTSVLLFHGVTDAEIVLSLSSLVIRKADVEVVIPVGPDSFYSCKRFIDRVAMEVNQG